MRNQSVEAQTAAASGSLARLFWAATAVLILVFGQLLVLVHSSQPSQPPHVVLVAEDEPGQTLIVRGSVYAPDGTTPVAGVRLDIHHTDAGGYYCRPPSPERDAALPRDNCPSEPPRSARLRGSLVTDAQGRYEFHTVKPGAYPRNRIPAHIHFKASGAGYAEQYPHSLWFADDPFIPAADVDRQAQLGKFRFICDPQPVGRRHAIQCEYNLRLERR